jgi:hypothetical protein
MARKMVLVPEEMYRGLLSSSDTLGNTARVLEAKQAAAKVLRSRKKAGVRRVLYDKKMRDYLRLRREAVDRPVKVEISQTPVAATTTTPVPTAKPAGIPVKQMKKKRRVPVAPSGEPHVPPGEVYVPPPEEPSTQLPSTPPQTERAPPHTPFRSTSAPGRTPPGVTKRVAGLHKSRAHVEGMISEHADKVLEYVRQNRDRFGITEEGGIMGPKGGPVKGSNVEAAVRSLVRPIAEVGVSTPPGTVNLRSRLMKDDQANSMIKRALDVTRDQLGLGRRPFKPLLWKRY